MMKRHLTCVLWMIKKAEVVKMLLKALKLFVGGVLTRAPHFKWNKLNPFFELRPFITLCWTKSATAAKYHLPISGLFLKKRAGGVESLQLS